MGNIVFHCPNTGLNVQHWLAEEVSPGDSRRTCEAVICMACMRLHFINRATGKHLGEPEYRTQPSGQAEPTHTGQTAAAGASPRSVAAAW